MEKITKEEDDQREREEKKKGEICLWGLEKKDDVDKVQKFLNNKTSSNQWNLE
jgi:hypothetical protein